MEIQRRLLAGDNMPQSFNVRLLGPGLGNLDHPRQDPGK